MNIKSLPTFTQLTANSKIQSDQNTKVIALAISQKLDEVKNKYSSDQWRHEPVSNHYRNTFVEAQNESFLKRLNKI